MRITVRFRSEKGKRRRLWLWLPNTLLFSRLVWRIVNRHAPQTIPLGQNLGAVKRQLRNLKRRRPRLPLVEVVSADGEGVRIRP